MVADRGEDLLVLSGAGDVVEPELRLPRRSAPAGRCALSAARALLEHSHALARAIAEAALGIAADVCIYTNRNLSFQER